MKQNIPKPHEVDATRYSLMSRQEKVDLNKSIINDPTVSEKERDIAEWRLSNINHNSMETVLAAILLTVEFEEGSRERDALDVLINEGIRELRQSC